MATIPSTNYSSADVIQEAAGSVRAFNSNDADVRNLAGVPSGDTPLLLGRVKAMLLH